MGNGDHRRILQDIARQAMRARGLEPEFPPAARAQVARLGAAPTAGLQDLRDLPWSSIDNDESRDLDQIEVCIADGNATRLLVAIADVDSLVTRDSPVDEHARINTTSVYTPAEVFRCCRRSCQPTARRSTTAPSGPPSSSRSGSMPAARW